MRRLVVALVLLTAAACGGGGGEAPSASSSPIPSAPAESAPDGDPAAQADGPVAYTLLSGEGLAAIDTADGDVVVEYVVPVGGSGFGGLAVDADRSLVLFHRATTGSEAQVVELTTDDGSENVRLSDAAWPAPEAGGDRWAHVEDSITDDGSRLVELVLRNRIGEELERWHHGAVPADIDFEQLPLRNTAFGPDEIAVQAAIDADREVVLVVPLGSGGSPLTEVATRVTADQDASETAAPSYRGEELTVAVRSDDGRRSRVVAVGDDGGLGDTVVDGIDGHVLEMDWDAAGEGLLLVVERTDDTALLVWDGNELRELTTGVVSASW
ncbi:MAG: hypothetical protein R3343_09260 [Nitriliruptorales bacterium]|nr:hypothetical protein [Nitriliruptorales bacterium]